MQNNTSPTSTRQMVRQLGSKSCMNIRDLVWMQGCLQCHTGLCTSRMHTGASERPLASTWTFISSTPFNQPQPTNSLITHRQKLQTKSPVTHEAIKLNLYQNFSTEWRFLRALTGRSSIHLSGKADMTETTHSLHNSIGKVTSKRLMWHCPLLF